MYCSFLTKIRIFNWRGVLLDIQSLRSKTMEDELDSFDSIFASISSLDDLNTQNQMILIEKSAYQDMSEQLQVQDFNHKEDQQFESRYFPDIQQDCESYPLFSQHDQPNQPSWIFHPLEESSAKTKETKSEPIKRKKDIDYLKNICPYIQKKILTQFLSLKNYKLVKKICSKCSCSAKNALDFYKSKEKIVFGVGTLATLLIAESNAQKNIKRAFYLFMNFYLDRRYPLYLVKNGKMSDKEAYLDFKNKFLRYFEAQTKQTKLRSEKNF